MNEYCIKVVLLGLELVTYQMYRDMYTSMMNNVEEIAMYPHNNRVIVDARVKSEDRLQAQATILSPLIELGYTPEITGVYRTDMVE